MKKNWKEELRKRVRNLEEQEKPWKPSTEGVAAIYETYINLLEQSHKAEMREFADDIRQELPVIPSYRFVSADDIIEYNKNIDATFEKVFKKYNCEEEEK